MNIESMIPYIISFLIVIIILILLIVLKPKKVKPIEVTIDDDKEEKSDIEKVIEALEENKEGRKMTSFEEEQEANAIISYQELVQAVKEKKLQLDSKNSDGLENVNSTKDQNLNQILEQIDSKESITPEPVISQISQEESLTSEPVLEIEEPNIQPQKSQPKFKNSEFISPIFGKDNNNDKFLKDLKDFRNNL